jgi:hypothetical protein
VTFATVSALQSAVAIKKSIKIDLSEQYPISCLIPEILKQDSNNVVDEKSYCDSGVQIGKLLTVIGNKGISSELSVLPYSGLIKNNACSVAKSALNSDNYSYVPDYQKISISDAEELKYLINRNGPVIASLILYPSFSNYKSGVYKPKLSEVPQFCGTKPCGHAVSVVGYSDKIAAFKVKNSWGINWGEKGFFWVAYNQVNGPMKFGTRGDGVYAINNISTPFDCNIQISDSTIEAPSTGEKNDRVDVKLLSGKNCSWKPISYDDWIDIGDFKSNSDGFVYFNVSPNQSGEERSGSIVIKSDTDEFVKKVYVLQK